MPATKRLVSLNPQATCTVREGVSLPATGRRSRFELEGLENLPLSSGSVYFTKCYMRFHR